MILPAEATMLRQIVAQTDRGSCQPRDAETFTNLTGNSLSTNLVVPEPQIVERHGKDRLMRHTFAHPLESKRLRFGMITGLGVVLFATCAFRPMPASAADTLEWKFKPGETLKYTMVQQTTQGVKAMGQEFKTNLNQTVDLHWSVKGVSPEGLADLTQTIDRIRTKIEAPGNAFEYDSEGGKAPEGQIATLLAPLLKALVGAEFTFKMNGRGELSDVKIPQKLLDSLKLAGPAAAGGSMFSEEGMKNMISQSSLAFPATSLDRGKTWSNQSKVPLPMIGTMVLDKTYTYQGPSSTDPQLLQVGLETKVTLEPAADSNVAVKITDQKGKGEFVFDSRVWPGRFLSCQRPHGDVAGDHGSRNGAVDRHRHHDDPGQVRVVALTLGGNRSSSRASLT